MGSCSRESYGKIVKILPYRSYTIETDGGQYRRNKWHLILASFVKNDNVNLRRSDSFNSLCRTSPSNYFQNNLINPIDHNLMNKNLDRLDNRAKETIGSFVNDSNVNCCPAIQRGKPGWLKDFVD
ncbi:unnamed protein product [Diatraea saccharalis]|uniref:Uncharacterized protein n=1 Tax=Diatraea saccharalis TaxID=40085 RepID=A0A9N9N229_9NEOP|nr:unnamed protein product [Diatraea saccharalis]